MQHWTFTKGHGTQNDFVLILDRSGTLDLTPDIVRFLCDRHAGIGADGILRVVPARYVTDQASDDPTTWFMDYRNADGSVAEMCGNGARVFVRYLLDHDLAPGPYVSVATRDGVKQAEALPDGRIRVEMGPVHVGSTPVTIRTCDGAEHTATTADVGNPHAVCLVADVAAVPLHLGPTWDPGSRFPAGVNVEFVQTLGPQHLALRVFERGSGETRSCGTGTVAAAAVAHRAAAGAFPATYRVDVPGGTVEVELTADQAYLTGPAQLVATGEVGIPF